MSAYNDLKHYLKEYDMLNAEHHVEPIIEMVLKVLSERRGHPQKFAVMPLSRFRSMMSFEESSV